MRTRKREATSRHGARDKRLFTFDVSIISGPMTKRFVKENPVVSRTIQIRGDQTLADLHGAIFGAFDREEEHLYGFQIGGRGPMDPKARRYVLPMAIDNPFDERKPAGAVMRVTIGSFALEVGEAFGYWFDFGDDWWHQVDVLVIDEGGRRGKLPQGTGRVGQSPPQYVDWDEEA